MKVVEKSLFPVKVETKPQFRNSFLQIPNMNENMEDSEDKNSRRPKNSAFKQQRLKAWQPILTAQVATIFFLVIFIVFIIFGAVLLVASDSVREKVLEYTHCEKYGEKDKTCDQYLEENSKGNITCKCIVKFELSEDFEKQVYLYYGLTNFYQNHRRYVRSRDDAQLRGDLSQSVASDCKPYAKDNKSQAIAPCGTIANSLFNDTFKLYYARDDYDSDNKTEVKMTIKNIAWKSDRETKFQNPDDMKEFEDFAKPPNWPVPVDKLDTKEPSNNGFENQDFIVWMRTAAFPKFRKLFRKVNHNLGDDFEDSLPKGKYLLHVNYRFPVTSFDGEKRFIISNTSWLGGKNPFLGIAYLVVGSLSGVMSGVFFYIHLKVKSRRHDQVDNVALGSMRN